MTASKVGADIDAWCTRCKMNLGHTILAMVSGRPVRVRCNTCQGEHNYRGDAGSEPRKGSWEPREVRERRAARPSDQLGSAARRKGPRARPALLGEGQVHSRGGD